MGPNPKIAGMAPEAFIKTIKEYQDGTRPNPTKKAVLGSLSEEDIANLAAYYAGL
jgi:cytochrome c553